MHVFFSCQLNRLDFFSITFHCKVQTHTYVLLILLYHIYLSIYFCHSFCTIKLYTSSEMNINKLIYTGAEEGVEVVECTGLDLS